MGPKKGRRVRKIEVPTDSVPKFELWDTAANIQRRREEREAQKERKRHRNRGKDQEGGNYTLRGGSVTKGSKERQK